MASPRVPEVIDGRLVGARPLGSPGQWVIGRDSDGRYRTFIEQEGEGWQPESASPESITDAHIAPDAQIQPSKIAGLEDDLAALEASAAAVESGLAGKLDNVLEAPGDLLVGGPVGAPAALPIGSAGLPLVSDGTTPGYAPLGTDGLADEAVTPAKIERQTAGTVLKGKGAGAAVAFEPLLGTDVPAATDSARGTVELATKAEMETGTDTGRVPSVATLQHHKGVAKAWVRFDPSGTILESHGVSSVTDIGTGNWQVHWATPFATSTYVVQGTASGSSAAPGLRSINIGQSVTTSTHVACRNDSNGLADPEHSVMVTAWGTV